MADDSLKMRTARSVKWGAIDRFASQVLYAITGIVLARLLSPADFGLVGAALIFQAFALIVIDSGFSYALLQRKDPSRLDYSSALWFNIGVSVILYIILYACAPWIADLFQHDERIIPLARAMFATMILNATATVQINQLTKRMQMRPIAIANVTSLAVGGIVGIVLAVKGFGAWAIVWQAIANSGVKSLILWLTSHWLPMLRFSWASIRALLPVGSGMMATSFLNTVFLNVYSFFIGSISGMSMLGYYTQSDKWSKMGIMSLSQTLTSAFIPPLSAAQDDPERFQRLCHKMNRLASYIAFPFLIGLIAMAAPIFHALFGTKWDFSIPLFQLLLARGVLTVFINLYNNYLLALGRSKLIMAMEVVKDTTALFALFATLPYLTMANGDDLVYGIKLMIWGQIIATMAAWLCTLIYVCRACGASAWSFVRDCLPYAALTLAILPLLFTLGSMQWNCWLILLAQAFAALAIYLLVNHLLGSKIQHDVLAYLRGKSI